MKYLFLLLFPALSHGQIMEDFLTDESEVRKILFFAQKERDYSIECMGNTDIADYFYFHKGRAYAFQAIINLIDED